MKSKIDQVLDKTSEISERVGVQGEKLSNIESMLEKQNHRITSTEKSINELQIEHAKRSTTCKTIAEIAPKVERHEAALNKLGGIQWFVVKVISLTAALVAIISYLL